MLRRERRKPRGMIITANPSNINENKNIHISTNSPSPYSWKLSDNEFTIFFTRRKTLLLSARLRFRTKQVTVNRMIILLPINRMVRNNRFRALIECRIWLSEQLIDHLHRPVHTSKVTIYRRPIVNFKQSINRSRQSFLTPFFCPVWSHHWYLSTCPCDFLKSKKNTAFGRRYHYKGCMEILKFTLRRCACVFLG